MRDFKASRFKKGIGITEEDLEWIKKYKGKKSAAGFLEEIIRQYKNDSFHDNRQSGG